MKNSSNFQLNLTIIITLLIHLFLLLQNMFAAYYFGISSQMDAYNIAFNITTFIFSFFAVSVTTVLIPSLNNNSTNASNTFITTFGIVVLLIVLLIFLLIEKVTTIFFHNSTIPNIVYILTIGFIFKAFTGIIIAFFQFNNSFVTPKLVQAFSAVLVVTILFFADLSNIIYFSIAISLGFIVEFFINILLIKRKKIDYKYKIKLELKNKEFRRMMANFFPIFFSTALYQVMLLINIAIAENLGDGNVSILTYSNQLFGMINALLVVNLLTFLFPKLVKLISINKESSIAKLEDYIIIAITIMSFTFIAFFIHGKDVITIIFQRGLFDSSVTEVVYSLSVLYFLLLPIGAVRDLFYRYFYADNDTFTPFKNSIIVSILNISLSVVLSKYFGLYGIVIGTVLAGMLSLIMIVVRFKKKYHDSIFNIKMLFVESIKLVFIGCLLIVTWDLLNPYYVNFNIYSRILFFLPLSTIFFFSFLFVMRGKFFSIRV